MWICPICGMKNDDSMFACASCVTPREDNAVEVELREEVQDAVPEGPASMIGHPTARDLCERVSEAPSLCNDERLVFTEIRTGERLEIVGKGGFVGRVGDYVADCFTQKISRQHVCISRTDGGWDIEHFGRNPTVIFADGERIELERGVKYPLYAGEMVRMADLSFRVSVETCPDEMGVAEESTSEDNEVHSGQRASEMNPPSMVTGWFIDCPGGCGSSYLVADESATISACPHCFDSLDKRRIARVRPQWSSRREGSFEDVRR